MARKSVQQPRLSRKGKPQR